MRVSIPHTLGREEVRKRMHARIGELGANLPGIPADVKHSWQGEDQINLDVQVMGQQITGQIEIEDALVWVDVQLPVMLAFMEPVIQSAVRDQAESLLEDKSGS